MCPFYPLASTECYHLANYLLMKKQHCFSLRFFDFQQSRTPFHVKQLCFLLWLSVSFAHTYWGLINLSSLYIKDINLLCVICEARFQLFTFVCVWLKFPFCTASPSPLGTLPTRLSGRQVCFVPFVHGCTTAPVTMPVWAHSTYLVNVCQLGAQMDV